MLASYFDDILYVVTTEWLTICEVCSIPATVKSPIVDALADVKMEHAKSHVS